MTGTKMAALTAAAAMATVTIEPEKRSRMMISFALQCVTATKFPHEPKLPLCGLGRVYRGSVCGEKMVCVAYLLRQYLPRAADDTLGLTSLPNSSREF
jgi:hypothetical protein